MTSLVDIDLHVDFRVSKANDCLIEVLYTETIAGPRCDIFANLQALLRRDG